MPYGLQLELRVSSGYPSGEDYQASFVALIMTVYSLRGEELKAFRILASILSSRKTHSLYETGVFGRASTDIRLLIQGLEQEP